MSALRARLQAFFGGLRRWYAGHSPRDQRIIVGILAFGAVCVAYLWGWVPMREYRQRVADEIVEGQQQLARAARVLASADTVRADREELEQKLKQSRHRLLPGRGGTLGAAALQERTNSLAAEKGVTVQSTQVMKEEAIDPYRKVAVRLTVSGELKPFAEFVSGLEYDQQLAVPIVEINRRGAVAGAKGPRTLSATIEVAGFVLSEEAKAEDGSPAEGAEAAETAPAEGADAAKLAGAAATGPTGPAAAPPGATGAPTGPVAGASGPTEAATVPAAGATDQIGGHTGPATAAPGPTGIPPAPARPLPGGGSGTIPAAPFGVTIPGVPTTPPTTAPRVTPPAGSSGAGKPAATTKPVQPRGMPPTTLRTAPQEQVQ